MAPSLSPAEWQDLIARLNSLSLLDLSYLSDFDLKRFAFLTSHLAELANFKLSLISSSEALVGVNDVKN